MSLLEVRDIHVGYGKVEAVLGVTIAAEREQITTIIGANGAGKTTLLSAIAGLNPARAGSVWYEGRDITRLSVEDRVNLGLILVHEQRELFSDMSIQDNLLLGAYSRRKAGRRAIDQDIDNVYQLFPRLRERRKQRAGSLSGGERQMLALGRALMARPRLLLLDEPSLGLAPIIVNQVFDIIGKLRDDGLAIVLVEQNARAALAIAQSAYVIETGRIALQGKPSDLAADPRVLGTFLGGGVGSRHAKECTTRIACAKS